jgi:hypothetical protein
MVKNVEFKIVYDCLCRKLGDMIWYGESIQTEKCVVVCTNWEIDLRPRLISLDIFMTIMKDMYVYIICIYILLYTYIYIIYPPKMNTISFSLWKKTFGGSSIHPVDQQRCLMTWSSTTSATVVPKDWYPQPGATSEERSVATVFTKDRDTLVTSRNHGGCRGWNHIMGPYNGAD